MPTATTVPLIILLIVLWRMTKGQILPCVLFVSVFSAASAFNIGALGVSPWQFVLAVGLFMKLLKGHRPFRFTSGLNRLALHLAIIFFAYAAWTGFVYPFVFHGVTIVRTTDPEPLAWSMSNFAQLCYLLAAAVVYLLTVSSSREELQQAMDWYLRGCITAAYFAMYQLLNAIVHVPYPDMVLYTNPSHVIYRAYMINGMWRLNSTFNEASEMSGFLIVGLGLLGWSLMTQPLRKGRIVHFCLILLSMLLTISSVGYAGIGFIFLCGAVMFVVQMLRGGGVSPIKAIIGLTMLTGTVTLFTLSSTAGPMVNKVITSTLLDKKNSDSYKSRTETHATSLETMRETYYMGAGWGSVRASGLLFVLLGNVGVIGCAIYIAFNCSLLLPLFQSSPPLPGGAETQLFEKSLFAIMIFSLTLLMAGAAPIDPVLWVLFGIATVGRLPAVSDTRSAAFLPLGSSRQLVSYRPEAINEIMKTMTIDSYR